jgi:hypothetical protein
MQTMSSAAARRTALAAQGFADPVPGTEPSRRHLQRVLSRIQLIQLDSVNVVLRAHYAPLFARLGPYKPSLIDDAAWSHTARRPRLLVENWAHEASLIPVEDWPLLHSGAKRRGWWQGYERILDHAPTLAEDVLAVVKEQGPIGAGAIEKALVGPSGIRAPGAWWERSEVKKICEWLFGIGQLTTGTRRSFERLYDLTERVIPPEIASRRVSADEAARELIAKSATALGVATEADLRDYYRLGPTVTKRALSELVEAGAVEPVRITEWRTQAYRSVDARTPRAISGRALLCPFDPLIWERERTRRIFGFSYRIEIYVPEPKRIHGYYVFPFLLDGSLVARVDLKADRGRGVLRVPGVFAESKVDRGRVAEELAAELNSFAHWLGLSGVEVGDRGDLADQVRVALKSMQKNQERHRP